MSNTGKYYSTLKDMCDALSISPSELIYIAHNTDKFVKTIHATKKDGTARNLVAPNKRLKLLQKEIKKVFFGQYHFPNYVFGLGGNTLAQHASIHSGNAKMVKVDIRDFFPSITNKHVYRMWLTEFDLKPEISRLLTKLTTLDGHLQQGYPTSSHIAAVISGDLSASLNKYCLLNQINFTQYVDDFIFSGASIEYKSIFKIVVDTARMNGFKIKRSKSTVINSPNGKLVTGVAILNSRLRAPRLTRKKAIHALKELGIKPDNKHLLKRAKGYGGYMYHLRSSDGKKYLGMVNSIITRKRAKGDKIVDN